MFVDGIGLKVDELGAKTFGDCMFADGIGLKSACCEKVDELGAKTFGGCTFADDIGLKPACCKGVVVRTGASPVPTG